MVSTIVPVYARVSKVDNNAKMGINANIRIT